MAGFQVFTEVMGTQLGQCSIAVRARAPRWMEVAAELRGAYKRGKAHAIAVVAEGARYNARALSIYFQEHKERFGI
jgi:hypothetical protein